MTDSKPVDRSSILRVGARDPHRLEPLLVLLERVWRLETDMRLGQLVMCASAYGNYKSNDIFYVEDDIIVDGLQRMLDMNQDK